jgi:hypothetical protein
MFRSCLVVANDVDAALLPFSAHLVVEPYRDFLESEEIRLMSRRYEVPPNDLEGLQAHMAEWREEEGGVFEGRLFAWSTQNPEARWDWYKPGGILGPFLELRTPLRRSRWLAWFRPATVTHVTRASKRDVNPIPLLANPPAAVLFDGEWHEIPIAGADLAEWRGVFRALFDRVPDDAVLNAIVLHS